MRTHFRLKRDTNVEALPDDAIFDLLDRVTSDPMATWGLLKFFNELSVSVVAERGTKAAE